MTLASSPASARRVAIAASGAGRTLANLLRHQRSDTGYEIAAVIASRPDCDAVQIATAHTIPLFIADFSAPALLATGERMYQWLRQQNILWIALAGFIKLFPLDPARQARIVNIHPSLLPKHGGKGMYGDKVHSAVLAAGEPLAGASVHFVTEHYDEGALIAQVSVPVLANDTLCSLADRVFAAESQLYPQTLNRLLSGALPLPAGAVERSHYAPA